MTTTSPVNCAVASRKQHYCNIASYVLSGLALAVVLYGGMVTALFSGLLAYYIVDTLAPILEKRLHSPSLKLATGMVLGSVVVGVLACGVWWLIDFFMSDSGSIGALLPKVTDIISSTRSQMPLWVAEKLPRSVDELSNLLMSLMREHAGDAKLFSSHAGHVLVHALLGMLIGVMVAVTEWEVSTTGPLGVALQNRLNALKLAFSRILTAQLKISAINTVFTALYLYAILPLCGVELPFKMTIVVVAFIGGLLPVAGNLIANTLLVTIGLTYSLHVAVASLAFMVVLHKCEYFLNAAIIGRSISSRAVELLAAMLVMETIFGIPGLIAAPVFYAYIKNELSATGLL